MIPGEVRGSFFQELVLHAQFPRLAFELAEPFPFADVQRRLVTGMLAPIRGDPVPECAFSDTEFTSNRGDRS